MAVNGSGGILMLSLTDCWYTAAAEVAKRGLENRYKRKD
jgi:hypothetical protein